MGVARVQEGVKDGSIQIVVTPMLRRPLSSLDCQMSGGAQFKQLLPIESA